MTTGTVPCQPRLHNKKIKRESACTPSQGQNEKRNRMVAMLDELKKMALEEIYLCVFGFNLPTPGTQKTTSSVIFFFFRVPLRQLITSRRLICSREIHTHSPAASVLGFEAVSALPGFPYLSSLYLRYCVKY